MRRLRITATVCAIVVTGCSGSARNSPAPVVRATYQPYSAGYRGITVGRIEQEFNGQVITNGFGKEYFVTAEVVAATPTLSATLVLDSIIKVRAAGSAASAEQATAARGATFTGTLAPTGEIVDFHGSSAVAGVAKELVERLFKQFFPRIPRDGAKAGELWTDTLETTADVGGVRSNVHAVNNHAATGWITHTGRRALHIVSETRYVFSGSGTQAGQDFTLKGEGQRLTHQYIGADGRYLGFTATDSARAQAKLAQLGLVIPVRQTRFDTLAIIAH